MPATWSATACLTLSRSPGWNRPKMSCTPVTISSWVKPSSSKVLEALWVTWPLTRSFSHGSSPAASSTSSSRSLFRSASSPMAAKTLDSSGRRHGPGVTHIAQQTGKRRHHTRGVVKLGRCLYGDHADHLARAFARGGIEVQGQVVAGVGEAAARAFRVVADGVGGDDIGRHARRRGHDEGLVQVVQIVRLGSPALVLSFFFFG